MPQDVHHAEPGPANDKYAAAHVAPDAEATYGTGKEFEVMLLGDTCPAKLPTANRLLVLSQLKVYTPCEPPMPILPDGPTLNSVVFVDDEMVNRFAACPAVPCIVRFEAGLVVPMPTCPAVFMNMVDVPTAVFVPERYAIWPVVPETEPPPPDIHVPPTAKHPFERLIPPVDENDEVAVEKLIPFVLPSERREPGVVDAMPRNPLGFTVISAEVEVAPASEILVR